MLALLGDGGNGNGNSHLSIVDDRARWEDGRSAQGPVAAPNAATFASCSTACRCKCFLECIDLLEISKGTLQAEIQTITDKQSLISYLTWQSMNGNMSPYILE